MLTMGILAHNPDLRVSLDSIGMVRRTLRQINAPRPYRRGVATAFLTGLLLATGQVVFAQIEMLDQVVAIVDDDIILASELQERVQGVRSTMEARGVEMPEEEVLVRETLDRLILDSIQLQLANRYGVRIPDQQLDESMARLAQQNGLSQRHSSVRIAQGRS